MDQTKLNNLNLNDFLKQIDSASKNLFYFAKFVRDGEIFCNNEKSGIIDENLVRYRKIWFDLEVINALALDDWESAGKPENWLLQWQDKYKNDAQEVIAELRAVSYFVRPPVS